MAIQIQRRASTPIATDAAGRLLECHARIRDFIATAIRLTEAADVSDTELAMAAAGGHRYFAEALPLHAADEDASIAPRLVTRAPGEEVARALQMIAAEHAEHEVLLGRLLPWWARVAASPGHLRTSKEPWREDTRELEALITR